MTAASRRLLLVLGRAVLVGWLDPHATRARGQPRSTPTGKFDDAAAKYNEALVDEPDSPLLRFNLGAPRTARASTTTPWPRSSRCRDRRRPGAHARASPTTSATPSSGSARRPKAAKPQKALELYAEALVAYRRAMGADPADEDAKFNHELVAKRIAELKKKLEEQQKEQEQQKQQEQQQQNQEKQEQQPQDQEQQQGEQEQQQQDQQQGQEQQQDEQQQQQQAGEQQQEEAPQPEEQEQAGAQDEPGEEPRTSSRRPAARKRSPARRPRTRRCPSARPPALLDAPARPGGAARRDHRAPRQGAVVAEPREDW